MALSRVPSKKTLDCDRLMNIDTWSKMSESYINALRHRPFLSFVITVSYDLCELRQYN